MKIRNEQLKITEALRMIKKDKVKANMLAKASEEGTCICTILRGNSY
jgi:hypothetical protein